MRILYSQAKKMMLLFHLSSPELFRHREVDFAVSILYRQLLSPFRYAINQKYDFDLLKSTWVEYQVYHNFKC